MTKEKTNKLLSRRVRFPSLTDLLDQWAPRFVEHFKLTDSQAEVMRQGLLQMLEEFLSGVRHAFALGVEKGMDEASDMFKDPEYYEVVKNRRKAEAAKRKEYRPANVAANEERDRRRNFPTYEEKIADIQMAFWEMARMRKTYLKHKAIIEGHQKEEGGHIVTDAITRSMDIPDNVVAGMNFNIDSWVKALSSADISDAPKDESHTDDLTDFFDKHSEWE